MRNSRSDVVAAAMRVLDAHGLEGCSMRRVAADLGVQPGALYHHVPNKQTLLALMADEIVADVGPDADPRATTAACAADDAVRLCRALRDATLRVRDGADVVATAAAFRLGASRVEAELAALVGPAGARTLLLYTFGHAQSTQTRLQARVFGALVGDADALQTDDADAALLDSSFAEGLAIISRGLLGGGSATIPHSGQSESAG